MRQEHVILLNEQDQLRGTLERHAAHTATTPPHSAFSCWISNEQGQLLVIRRSLHKKAWPGAWTSSICGHPRLGETYEAAIVCQARFELGADTDLLSPVYDDFRYCATDPSGIVENGVRPVYTAHIVSPLQLNPDEVVDCQWSSLEDVLSGTDVTPWTLSLWMVMQVVDKEACALSRNYCQQTIV